MLRPVTTKQESEKINHRGKNYASTLITVVRIVSVKSWYETHLLPLSLHLSHGWRWRLEEQRVFSAFILIKALEFNQNEIQFSLFYQSEMPEPFYTWILFQLSNGNTWVTAEFLVHCWKWFHICNWLPALITQYLKCSATSLVPNHFDKNFP